MSIGTKLALTTVGVLVIASSLLYLELTGRERRALLSAKQTAASMVADLFAASLAAPLDFDDTDAIEAEIGNVKINAEITCAAVWLGAQSEPVAKFDRQGCGALAAPTDAEMGEPQIHPDNVQVARVVTGRLGNPVGKALLVFSLARENETFAASRAHIFWISFALAATTAMLLIVLARRQIVSPLKELSTAARRIGSGDFDTRVSVASHDEIGDLGGALNRMRQAISDRQQRLEAVTQSLRDLFDHMRQAILAFGPDGKVQGAVSRQATRVFARAELERVSVRELLYGDAQDADAQAFDEWLTMAFELPVEQWAAFAALAPQEVSLAGNEKVPLPLELEFRPVVKGTKVERVMLLATDVTEKRRLEQTMHTQEEEHARRMTAMRRLIAGGGQVFVTFIESAHEKIARCIELVGPAPRMLATGEIDELFRHVHTIKGEARAFDLRELETETGKLEEELDELRALARSEGFVLTGSVHAALVASFGRAAEAIERGRDVFVDASPIGRSALDQVTVQRSDLDELAKIAEGRDDALARVVARLSARPFGQSTASLVDMAPTWADKEGKRARLEVEGREVSVPPALSRVLGGVMTHLVRNAIAHGIEPPAVRTEGGKSPIGIIRVGAVADPSPDVGPIITVEDDGRGLDVEGIALRASQLGMRVRDRMNMGELVFAPGLSTVQSAGRLAGRGVGLGAVRADLEQVGYSIGVWSERGRFTRFVLKPA